MVTLIARGLANSLVQSASCFLEAKPAFLHLNNPIPTNNQEKWEIEMIEKLAAIEHERWANWQKYVFSKCEVLIDGSTMIPRWAVDQWTRQIETPYEKLTEAEKDSDRREVNRYFPFLRQEIRQAKIETCNQIEVVVRGISDMTMPSDTKLYILEAISNLKNNDNTK